MLKLIKFSVLLQKATIVLIPLLFAGVVSAATLSQVQTQTTDGQNFTFNFAPSDRAAGTGSTVTLEVQGDFNLTTLGDGSVDVTLGNVSEGQFTRVSPEAYDVSAAGFANLNAYKYKLNFDLNSAQTDSFLSNGGLVGMDFSADVTALCGWFNYSNCLASGDAPFAAATYTYNIPEVPIPAALWLFGSALLGLAGIARRKRA